MDIQDTFDALVLKLKGWFDSFILMLPNLLVAILVVYLFGRLARLASKLIERLLGRVSQNENVNSLLATLGRVGVMMAGVFIALSFLKLDRMVTSLLAGAGIIGLALGFAFQDIAANFISGVLLSIRRPFTRGELIRTNDLLGLVEVIDLRSTTLRTLQGELVILPNKDIYQNPLANLSRSPTRRVDLECGVSYGDDLERAQRVALDALDQTPGRDPDQPVRVFFTGFGDSSINFVAQIWTENKGQAHYLEVRSEAIKRLKAAFDAHDITIPFPIRTLDFGIVGGEKLSEMWAGGASAPARPAPPERLS